MFNYSCGVTSSVTLYDNLVLLGGVAVIISVTKEGVKFSTRGDIGSANIVCRQNTSVDKVLLLAFSLC